MRNAWLLAIALVTAVIATAEPAYGWGPATHIGLATDVLNHLALLPAAVAAVLARNKLAFLYGNIAADVVFAKRLSRVKQFCHHWSTGFTLSGAAADDDAAAFAQGYLAHLAADTVAHGKFVPRQLLVTGLPVGVGHLYWELRADAVADTASWHALARLLDHDHRRHHDAMARFMTGTFLSHNLNRAIFAQMNAVAARASVRRTLDTFFGQSRWHLSPQLIDGYRGECMDRILSVLAEQHRSAVLREDPNGTSALMQVHVDRRRLRRQQRIGLSGDTRRREAAQSFAPLRQRLAAPPRHAHDTLRSSTVPPRGDIGAAPAMRCDVRQEAAETR